ncbi:uncharacterized protein LOC122318001 isoform X2 [Carya illinoinensis]|uniref:uncharacterized protein LOC122318001 isoform X2 n=1 Tax=Carya illinoinensis TaxID=32201 RepID=UPI001C71F91C|nr:uncharacterized protein LOC122318001 isoform X2 [Carya illinoinensis]
MIHPECGVPLPLTVKVIRHEHPLKLTSSVQVNQSHHRICQLCVKVVDTYRFYYCSICDFAAHQDCATNEDDKDETFEFPENKHKAAIDVPTAALKEEDFSIDKSISIDPLQTHPPKIPFKRENSRFDDQYPKIPFKSENPRFDESINSVSYVAIEKKMIEESYVAIEKKMIEDSIDIDVEIKHFSHEHSLKLTNELLLTDEKCDGCIQCIQPPFYSCPQCPFFLHESCIKLPRKKRQLLHRHQLTLLPKAPYKGGLFLCRACDRICNGFTYNCDKCRFNLDVQCSLIPNKFTHEVHVHPLTYSSAPCKEKCSCCDSEGKVFRCADCEFTLDVKCATLPRNVRYRPFDQPFKLCYSAEDNSGEYYCDICEKRRDHEHWFYHCSDLQFPAHPRCILGAFPNIKFGRTITSSGHSHPLTLVHSSKDHTQCCKGCKGRISEILSFECAECNFNFHVSCLEGLDDIYIGHPLYPHSRIIGDYSYDSYYQ